MSLHLPYLGGPVSLGCLYDARTDQYLTGVKLWSIETTERMTTSQVSNSQTINIESDLNFSEKAKQLEIGASLKLSFLSGMVEVEKAGKYLNESKTSINSETLTLHYSIKTEFKELHLDTKPEYPEVLDGRTAATHVVTGIQFGARAFLVFERQLQDAEYKSEASDDLERLISKLKALLDASELFKTGFDEKELELAGQVKCRYYGDFELESPPLTLKEAVSCIESFRSQNAESAVTVYLTPLSQLVRKPQVTIKTISDARLNEAGDYCQLLNDAIAVARVRIKLLENTPWHVQSDQLHQFLRQTEALRTQFTQELAKKLRKYREKRGSSRKLASLVNRYRDKSPFSPQLLETWIRNKERECLVLQRLADSWTLSGATMLDGPSDLDQFGEADEKRIQIELLLPTSAYLQSCAVFLEKESRSGFLESLREFATTVIQPEPAKIAEETWIESESFVQLQSKLDDVNRFIGSYKLRPPKIGFACSLAAQNESVSLQVKYRIDRKWVRIENADPPTDFKLTATGATNANLCWNFPEMLNGFTLFKVNVRKINGEQRPAPISEYTSAKQVELLGLDPDTEYEAHAVALSALGQSGPSNCIKFTTERGMNCSEFARKFFCQKDPINKHRGEEFPGDIFQLEKCRIPIPSGCSCPNSDCVCPMSFQVGDKKFGVKPPKFLLVVGETGTGKSTFINGIANAFYRVSYEDNFRFKLIAEPEGQTSGVSTNQAHSQTSVVAVYTLFSVKTGGVEDRCKSAMDCPLTIIDTPGFGDTRGLAEDERIIKRIAKVLGEDGTPIPEMNGLLHTVGFVVKASQNRLTDTQKYIFDQALSLFGNDIEQIILPVLTFADSNEPQALSALVEGNVPHSNFLKLNNGMLYADNSAAITLQEPAGGSANDRIMQKLQKIKLQANFLDWDQGEMNYLKLFGLLEPIENGVSLMKTRGVLKERRTLENCQEGVMQNMRKGMARLTQLEEHLELIDSLDAVIKDADMKRTRRVKVPKVRKLKVTHNGYVTLCMTCSKTCHKSCVYSDNKDKIKCSAMDRSGNCTVCPGNCIWSQHCNRDYFFEDYEEEETVTVKDIVEKYDVKIQDRNAKEQLVKRMLEDFEEIDNELAFNLVTIHKCLQELDKLALRQYPLSVVGYVDNLIKVQETERKPGWKNRVKHLHEARESAQIISNAREGQDPFGESRARVFARCSDAIKSAKLANSGGATSALKRYAGALKRCTYDRFCKQK